FREDLFYRLAVIVIRIPPLLDRAGDIQLLARAFLHRFAKEIGREHIDFSPQALAAIQSHSWPGNVRELENRVKRAVIMADSARILPEDLELGSAATAPHAVRTLQQAREAAEREVLQAALERHGGKISPAAVELDISRPTFYELMEKLNIQRPPRESKAVRMTNDE
ncbi:MAG TPA: helix-turn-helix domain-containing protein, partial [Candidatus Paceibacterota bacterium]|nr:helix-turn-helix domain-containing protein [Candidatus Paceibacterota bacterium]